MVDEKLDNPQDKPGRHAVRKKFLSEKVRLNGIEGRRKVYK
jgi:hypothetical protein